jgi:hypothetical protein
MMAIVMTAEVPGLTEQQGRGMVEQVAQQLRQSKGFISHASGPIQGGFRVVEVWKSREDQQRFFDEVVAPMLQAAGAPQPNQQFFEAPNLLTP